MLTRAQNSLYWREWSAAKRALMPGRETWTKDEETTRRHEIHIQALGEEKSHIDFDNDDFDKVLAAFRAISRPGDLNAQLHALNGQRKRLLFGIRKLARSMDAGEAYVQAIIDRMDEHGALSRHSSHVTRHLDELHPRDLTKVMIALRKHEQRGVIHEPQTVAAAVSAADPF